MPQKNGTGPLGMGPVSGRGLGPCGGGAIGSLGQGRGFGRVMCGWFWRKYQGMPKNERKELLRGEIADLKQELEMVEGELGQIEKDS